MSQWGTVGLANSGLTPLQILRRFYPPDIYIAETNIFTGYIESFPGAPIRPGDRGFDVQVIQRFLNRIRRNYPAIPAIPIEDGVFGDFTKAAVMAFQRIFDLPQTGIVDKATWNKINIVTKKFSFNLQISVTMQGKKVHKRKRRKKTSRMS